MGSRTLPGSLAGKAYLLGYDLGRQKATGGELAQVVRGAVIAELNLRGCLTPDEGKVRASGTERTGDPVLDDVLRGMSEDKPRSWRSLVRRNASKTLCAVRRQLASAGVVTVEADRVLGIFPRTTVTVPNPEPVRKLQESVRTVVSGTGRVSTEDAVLVALADVGQLNPTLPRGDRKAHAARIKELTEQAKAAVPALSAALQQIKSARSAKQSGG